MSQFEDRGVAFKGVATMGFIVVILAGIKIASPIVVPLVLSAFIAVICNPVIDWMSKYRVPRLLAVLILMVLILLAGFWLTSVVGSSITEFSTQLPHYQSQLIEHFSWGIDKLQALNINITRKQIMSYFDPGVAFSMTTNMLSGIGNVMANLFLIVLTIVFMLIEAPTFAKKLHFAFDNPGIGLQQMDKFLHSVNRYMVIKSLLSLSTGIVIGVGLYFIGVDYALLWGVIAFLFNYIPNIGSIIAAVPAVLLAFIQLGTGEAGAATLLYIVTNTVIGNIIEPKYTGRGVGLSTLVVFLSLIFWGWLLGTVGMLLSVPLTMVVKIALEYSESGKWLSILLSDNLGAEPCVTINDPVCEPEKIERAVDQHSTD